MTANWQVTKRDYIENFIPFIATLISKKKYEKIDVEKIIDDFRDEFGLDIPYHPMHTILTRSKRRGLIRKSGSAFIPIMGKVNNYEFSGEAKKQFRQQEKTITEIKAFAKENYNYEMNEDKIELALIAFLKDYDLDILFAAEGKGVLPEISSSKKDKFIIYKYISLTNESEPAIFDFIVDIAIGHLMANSIFYRDFSKYVGRLKNVCFYLDTPFIFRLIGLEGDQKTSVYEEFIKTLHKEGACIKTFRHTYEESYEILEDCLNWVENPSYDPSRASAILRYFVENNYTKIDVQRFLNRIDSILSANYIGQSDIVNTPNKQKFSEYNEDEKKIQQLIVDIYKKSNPLFDENEKNLTLRRDVDSVASIYILRKGKTPKHIKDAGHIFMTTNSSIALAARRYELNKTENHFNIPACLTDTFVGTILWLQSPAKIFDINKRKIIADSYAALKPDTKLIKKFLAEVDKLRNEEKIDENTYYFLRRDNLVFELLEEKTMGDCESFDSSIITDIYNEITQDIKEEADRKYIQEKEAHKRIQNKYEDLEARHKHISITLENRAAQISKRISNFVVLLLALLIIFGVAVQIIPFVFSENPNLKIGLIILYSVLGILNIIFGFNLFKCKEYIQSKIQQFIIKTFSGNEI